MRYWKSIVTPLAFALYPVLFLYAHNQGQTYFGDVVRSLAIAALAAAALLLASALVFRNAAKAALFSSAFFVLFFAYGHVTNLFSKDSTTALVGVLAVEGVACAALGVFLFLTRRDVEAVLKVGAAIAIFLLTFPLATIAVGASRRALHGARTGSGTQATAATNVAANQPDVYYIILDSYASQTTLKEFYGFDNAPFLDALRARGFHIAENSRSNYGSTLLSLSSSLNMTYLDEMVDPYRATSDRTVLMDAVRDSLVVRKFKERGYRFVNVASGFSGTDPQPNADVEFRTKKGALNEFELLLVGTTPLARIPFFQETADPFLLRRYAVLNAFEVLPKTAEVPGSKFVLAHIVSPHPPFVFDSQGGMKERKGRFNRTKYSKEEYLDGFRGQVEFVNTRLLPSLDAILARYPKDRPPVIIIQGDHGPHSLKRRQNTSEAFYRERFGILNAYLIPPGSTCEIPDAISPVNSFRMIFSCLFADPIDPLPNESYYSSSKKPFNFKPVSQVLAAEPDEDSDGSE